MRVYHRTKLKVTLQTHSSQSDSTIDVTVRNSYASAVLGIVILSVRLSAHLSVTRVLCDETNDVYCRYFDKVSKVKKYTYI